MRSTALTTPFRRLGARAFSGRPSPAQAASLTAVGSREIFDSDHDAFRDLARSFFTNEVTPFHAEWEKAGEVPRELWTKAGELGLLSNMVPEEYGGLGLADPTW